MNFVLFLAVLMFLESDAIKLLKLANPIDLTWSFTSNSFYTKNTHPFLLTKQTSRLSEDGTWYAQNEFCTGEHVGTHFNAPYHRNRQGYKVHEIPLKHLIAHGIKVDLRLQTKRLKNKSVLLPQHLEKWVRTHGPIQQYTVLLVQFHWSQYYNNKTLYLGAKNDYELSFPGISKSAAEWIVKTKKIVGVGVDTAAVDKGIYNSEISKKILLDNNVYVLENLNIPAKFPDDNFALYVLPMKIFDGTGAPLRIIAVPEENVTKGVIIAVVPWYTHVVVLTISCLWFYVQVFLRN
ncbi:hypothetical protein RN001_014163 [Aquatica leii]|uniref:Uncharacterized protein n=1 Tax=Aquatica leii TaxID=1421715 RepID=A0AAN7QDQ1_9COLE|nr:hypothetical protein RN001_014163 [Aquatica leii]